MAATPAQGLAALLSALASRTGTSRRLERPRRGGPRHHRYRGRRRLHRGLFDFRVATYLRRDLEAECAKVVMTRRTNHGVGPYIDRCARVLDFLRSG